MVCFFMFFIFFFSFYEMQNYFDIANPSKNTVLHFGLHLSLFLEEQHSVERGVNRSAWVAVCKLHDAYRADSVKS